MTTLEDRLAALADDAPQAEVSPGLWERGLRLHRRRRRGTVAVAAAALVALSALGVASWRLADVDPAPAAPGDGLPLPDEFFNPSEFLPGTADDGPIGPLVGIVGAERAGSEFPGLAGVSTTGEYRFLDLPSYAIDATYGFPVSALSADGRRVAYWYGDDASVDGVAVYDTTSGHVDRLPIESDYGLAIEALLWSGDQLWFDVWRNDDATGNSSTGVGSRVWDLGTGDVIERSGLTDLEEAAPFGDGLVSSSARRLRFFEPTSARLSRVVRMDRSVQGSAAFAADGVRFAAIEDNAGPGVSGDAPAAILTGRLRGDGDVRMTAVPGVEANELLAWRDASHVVVLTYNDNDPFYYSVDVRTGEAERLSAPSPINWWPGVGVALDAWAGPVFDAPEPPSPMNPRLRAGLGLAIVVAAGLGLLVWRRRVRP
jgi:hypothetical protein